VPNPPSIFQSPPIISDSLSNLILNKISEISFLVLADRCQILGIYQCRKVGNNGGLYELFGFSYPVFALVRVGILRAGRHQLNGLILGLS